MSVLTIFIKVIVCKTFSQYFILKLQNFQKILVMLISSSNSFICRKTHINNYLKFNEIINIKNLF